MIKFLYFLIILQLTNKINAKKLFCEFDRHHDVCWIRDLHINSTNILLYEPNSIRHPITVMFSRSHINKFPSRLFYFYPTITSLTMQFALLTDIGESSFMAAEQLKELDLSNNILTKLLAECFQGARNLLDLNLSNNKINYLNSYGLMHLENLKNLDLSNNEFVNFNIEALQSFNFVSTLEKISLSFNKINSINFTKISLNKIKTIDLTYNDLSSIEIYNPTGSLKSLKCSRNNLTNIDFLKDLKELTYLSLSYNLITNFNPINKLKKLKDLGLRNTSFKIDDFQIFHGLENLMKIDLSENNLNSLNLNYITSEDIIRFLLEHNNFKEINYKKITEKFINLRAIAISGNNLRFNFNCTYLQEIIDFFLMNSIKVYPDNPFLKDKKYMTSIGYKNITYVHGILCLNGAKKEPGIEPDIQLPKIELVKDEINVEIEESVNQDFSNEECLPIEEKTYEYFKYSLLWILIVIVVSFLFYKSFVFYNKNEYFKFFVRFRRTSSRTDANLLCNEY